MKIIQYRQELRALLALAIPIWLTQCAQVAFGQIDTIMAGRLSPTDLAAVGIGAGFWAPVLLLFMGVLFITTPMIAKAKGENNKNLVASTAKSALILGAGLGCIAFLLLQILSFYLPYFGVPDNILSKATLFVRIIAFGLPASIMYTALRCYSEALGFARPMTIITVLALPVLVLFNFMFMYGKFGAPALGGAGAALATALVQWIMLLVLWLYIAKAKIYRNYPVFNKGFDISQIKPILKLGIPVGLGVFFEVSLFAGASLVVSPLGEIKVSAHQIAISVTSLLFMIPMSLANALSARIGFFVGKRDFGAFIVVQRLGFALATILALSTMALLWWFRAPIVAFYTTNDAVMQIATNLMVFALIYQLVDAWQVCAQACLRGVGDTKIPMIFTLIAYWGVAFPVGVYFTRYSAWGVQGVWIGFIVGLCVAFMLLLPRMLWQNKQLAQKFTQS